MPHKALTLFKPGGRQHRLEGRYIVQATPVVIEHTDACHRQDIVQARLPGDSRESWGVDIQLPTHIKLCTVQQLDEAVLSFFNRWPDALAPCPNCGKMTWNRKHFRSAYRDERCGDCWFQDFDAKMSKWAHEAQQVLEHQDVAQYHAGNRYRATCVVHPHGGDDVIVDVYTVEKLDRDIAVQKARERYPNATRVNLVDQVQLKPH